MAQEIERKFLVKGDFKPEAYQSIRITQAVSYTHLDVYKRQVLYISP